MLICSYEDRPSDIVGLKLLVCSLARHVPDVAIHLCCPDPPDSFRRWLAARPGVVLDQTVDPALMGWNAKPALLLRLLDAGHDNVIWMDSDLIVARDFRGLLKDEDSLVVTAEMAWNHRQEVQQRTRAWNLPLGRSSPTMVNSAFLRVTPHHRPLLQAWAGLLRTREYQDGQQIPFETRPPHVLGDQDVLGALLGAAEFEDLAVQYLARGSEIIHDISGGYHPLDRLANIVRPMPPLVHAQSYKPWRFPVEPALLREPGRYYNFMHVETSPYRHVARQYRAELDEDLPWLEVRSLLGKAAVALALGNPHMSGFLQSVVGRLGYQQVRASHLLRRVRRAAGRLRPD
jgi:hypothetical protein